MASELATVAVSVVVVVDSVGLEGLNGWLTDLWFLGSALIRIFRGVVGLERGFSGEGERARSALLLRSPADLAEFGRSLALNRSLTELSFSSIIVSTSGRVLVRLAVLGVAFSSTYVSGGLGGALAVVGIRGDPDFVLDSLMSVGSGVNILSFGRI